MNIFDFSVKRPVAVTMIILIAILLGGVSFSKLGLDLFPDMELPMLLVNTSFEGAGPEEVEDQLTRIVESSVATVEGVDTLTSYSSRGSSMVLVQFNWGTDLNEATNSIRERLDLVKSYLPSGVGTTTIMQMDPSALPIMTLDLAGDCTLADLTIYAKDTVQPLLERIEGVASVSISGGMEEEYRIIVDPSRLTSFGVNIGSIMQTLYQENNNVSAGSVTDADKEFNVRILGKYEDIEEIRNLSISSAYGGTLRLKDIAVIEKVNKEQTSYVYINGEPGIGASIMKASDANVVSTSKRIDQALERLVEESEGKYIVHKFYDEADFINMALSNVATSGIYGGILAILVLLIFLRNFRSTLIIAISIPVSIITTFAMMYFTGVTLNMLSLGGLSLGIGMMVDSSIVVLENVYRYREMGYSRVESALKGSKEVAGAVLASTVTTVVVFLPIVFVEGMAAQIFRPMALTICCSLLASMASAFLVVPMLSNKLMGVSKPNEGKLETVSGKIEQVLGKIRKGYDRLLTYAINNKGKIVIFTLVSLVVSLCLIPLIGTEFIPSTDTGSYTVDISLPSGTTMDTQLLVAQTAEEILWSIPENKEIMYSVGGGGNSSMLSSSSGGINFQATLAEDRKRDTKEILDEVRQKMKRIPDAEINVAATSTFMISTDGITINVIGDDMDILKEVTEAIAKEVEKVEGTREVETSFSNGSPELNIKVDRIKAGAYGLSSYLVSSTVNAVMQGATATQVRDNGQTLDVKIKVVEDYVYNVKDLMALTITSTNGSMVSLGDIATFEYTTSPNSIMRTNQSRQATVSCATSGLSMGTIVSRIQDRVDRMSIPRGVSVEFGGIYETMTDSFSDLGLALILAVILVYMVMAFQFENFLYPFIIMFSMPPMVIGVLLGLFLTGRTLNVVSLIGVIMLAGIVVNNAIVLVDYINILRKEENMDMLEAIKKAGPTRLRPIMMTTLTTVLAMFPMCFAFDEGGELMAPLATAVAVGLSFSTLITLVLVPVMYIYFENLTNRWRMKHPKTED